jgi:hypothetical protein
MGCAPRQGHGDGAITASDVEEVDRIGSDGARFREQELRAGVDGVG